MVDITGLMIVLDAEEPSKSDAVASYFIQTETNRQWSKGLSQPLRHQTH